MIFCAEPQSATDSVQISAAAALLLDQLLGLLGGRGRAALAGQRGADVGDDDRCAPAAAMASAISRPMPPPEPVTTATLPSIMPAITFSCAVGL